MIQIELTQAEDDEAVSQAILRQANAIRHDAHTQFMPEGVSRIKVLRWNIQGARAERAVAKWLGVPWSGEAEDGRLRRDIADAIEVRSTERNLNLIVKHVEQKKNPPSTPYLLTWGDPFSTKVDLVGWITLGDALDLGEHYERRGIWYSRVPYAQLRPLKDLHV